MENEFVYDDAPTGRFIILSDLKQEFPTGPLTVKSASEKKNAGGKTYPVLVLEDEAGVLYEVAAWPRDVKACIAEFGGKPTTWGPVVVARGLSRAALVPHKTLAKDTGIEEFGIHG